MKNAAAFFAFARERHSIYLRRQAGQPWPWTDDPILRQYRFTCVFRELDRTTQWFRTNVREELRDKPEVLLATVLFRWFNRITTGEAIFKQQELNLPQRDNSRRFTVWDFYLLEGRTAPMRNAIKNYCGKGPYVTGSYIILGQQGMPKLEGVLKCIEEFFKADYGDSGHFVGCNWEFVASILLERHQNNLTQYTLEQVWQWFRSVPYLGDFMAYEIVTDLRWTDLLGSAPDIMTWANPGPGAARGLARVYGRAITGQKTVKVPKHQLIVEMQELLALSRDKKFWPQKYPALEMRDVEHTLCEWSKYEKVRLSEGRPRQVYRRG